MIISNDGRIALAEFVKNSSLHMAWGSGNWSTENPPAPSLTATQLIAEVGRRKLSECSYVTPNVAGDIYDSNGARYVRSVAPTQYLYCEARFAMGENPTAVIREIGLFIGGTTAAGLPGGQMYFTPAQVVTRGRLLLLENRSPIIRNAASAETLTTVYKL